MFHLIPFNFTGRWRSDKPGIRLLPFEVTHIRWWTKSIILRGQRRVHFWFWQWLFSTSWTLNRFMCKTKLYHGRWLNSFQSSASVMFNQRCIVIMQNSFFCPTLQLQTFRAIYLLSIITIWNQTGQSRQMQIYNQAITPYHCR